MRFLLASFFVLSMAVFTACQTSGPESIESGPDSTAKEATPAVSDTKADEAPKVDEHGHEDTAPRIELADAKGLFDSGEAVFVDTRSESSWVTERIKGSINIPVADFEARIKEVPQGKTIIAYCS